MALIDVPPVGDRAVSVDAGINDVARGVITEGPFYCRVTVTRNGRWAW